jgi:2-dehydro-3-deoxyphosphooctonate aldolase (KDO 8-P synthase)
MKNHPPIFRKLLQESSEGRLLVIAGPSLLDDKALASATAAELAGMSQRLNISLVFKAAFKRVNSATSDEFTGLGTETALKHLKAIGKAHNLPVQTDVYNELDVFVASKYADILQIPAYLFRETTLLEAAARTGKIVNIRKGMTISGDEMAEAVLKIHRKGSNTILLTERGTMLGYGDVVVDFRNMQPMLKNNVPVFLDLSNTVAYPPTETKESDLLQRAFILGKGAVAAGASGIVIDAHSHPAIARESSGYCFHVPALEPLLKELAEMKKMVTNKHE